MKVRYIGCGGRMFEWHGIVRGDIYTVVEQDHHHGDNFYRLSGKSGWFDAQYFTKA